MTTPINPYVAGNPVGDSPAFIGRADVLREVVRVLRRPQDNAIVLYGQRRIGKTSILQHLAAQLPNEGPFRPVYFDLQDKAAKPLGDVLRELAHAIADKLGRLTSDLGADAESAFRQTWLPALLSDLLEGCSLVLLLDEFDVLADAKGEQAATAFFPYLRELMESDPLRLKFVFVIGRNINDLTNIVLSLFKGIPAQRVSLLSEQDTADLARLSQKNNSLNWPDDAVARVWQLTHGHPFLTQQLCSHVWERAYDQEPDEPPVITPADVDAAVSDALDASRNTMEWLWDGLPPAERVVISALAEAGPALITEDDLERLLRESGVRVVIRELQNAPYLLQDWDLIEPAKDAFCFRVELLRRWIAQHKPLRRVRDELDHIEPVAESLFRAADGFYRGGKLDQATGLLRQAIDLNPNHIAANQLLASILLAQGQLNEARQLLERLYEYQPVVARPRLIQTLLSQAELANDAEEKLAFYERVIELEPNQPEAITGRRTIWQRRGDLALKLDDLDTALKAYKTAELLHKVAEVEEEKRRREFGTRMQELESLQSAKQYQQALDLAHRLAGEYPTLRDWAAELSRLQRALQLADLYQRALGALHDGERKTAQLLLVQLVVMDPEYEEATRYLHLAVTGVDTGELQRQMQTRMVAEMESENLRQNLQTQLAEEKRKYRDMEDIMKNLRQSIVQLQAHLAEEQRIRGEAETIVNAQGKALEEYLWLEKELRIDKNAQQRIRSTLKKTAEFVTEELMWLQSQLEAERYVRQQMDKILQKAKIPYHLDQPPDQPQTFGQMNSGSMLHSLLDL